MPLATPDASIVVPEKSKRRDDPETFRAVRRLDWRFLLPHPSLGRVAYWGPTDDSLFVALSTFCDQVTILGRQRDPVNGTLFDTVVVRLASPSQLPTLLSHVQPGGVLYAEWYGRLLPPRVRREVGDKRMVSTSPRAVTRALAACEGADVHLYWHWPSFTACTRIIPLGDGLALAYALGGPQCWLGAVAQWLWQWRVSSFLVPCFSSVVRRRVD